ncbi:response regulator [uncultured Nonlabens sp.]|uniref:response regulator n=1 Tax=uncultured Nonlabens sp. TaxID=859306 RepID=UPI0030D8DD8F|tara:strand:+ start:15319 stop:17214 length:1896 start_codon:yes stop_codon:yes gene_type:complete
MLRNHNKDRYQLKILHLEDTPFDAELVARELKKGKIQFEILVVAHKKAFKNALQNFAPDILLTDHTLPSFDSLEAIKIIKQRGVKIPVILVTSTVSDEFAVEVMKAGADDYILKDRLHRLPQAVRNAMEKNSVKQKLHESEIFSEEVLSSLSAHIAVIDRNGDLLAVNKAWKDFGNKNGVASLNSISTGSNYFDVCKQAIEKGDPYAAKALTGIQSVLNKENEQFEMEYPCHSATQQRWFLLNIIKFGIDTSKVITSHVEITSRKLAEQSLQLSRSNLTALIENTNAIIYSLDTNFCYITFNKLLHDTLKKNYGLDIKIGDSVSGFLEKLESDEVNHWNRMFSKALKGKTVNFEKEFTIGPIFQCSSFSINPIWKNKTVVGLSCFVYDITKQKQQEKEKEKMTADLIQRNQILEQFTFIISHNLRAPTANIIGFSEILQDETLTLQEQKESLIALSASIKGLDTIIKEISNILQSENEVYAEKEFVSFSELVENIMISLGNIIEKNKVQINFDFSEMEKIYSLKIYIYSIFYNLISNSIKYSKPNVPPLIQIKSKKENDKIILAFKDNGLGIDMKTNSTKVFGLYNRFHSHVEGKGIGLFMVKTQVEALGGIITIASELDKGTTFTIIFKI